MPTRVPHRGIADVRPSRSLSGNSRHLRRCRSFVKWLSTKACSEADIKLKVRSLSEGVVSRKIVLPQMLVARVWAPALLQNSGGTGPLDEFWRRR